MISLKTFAGGLAVAGSLGLAVLGIDSGVANAAPEGDAPHVTFTQTDGAGDGQTSGGSVPSPYADYGGTSICADPSLYFVNICT